MKFIVLFYTIIAIVITSVNAEAGTKKKLITYRNNEYKFVFQYPSTWTQTPSTHAGTKIKIQHNNGDDGEDCMINIQPAKTAQDRLPPKQFVDSMSASSYEQAMKKTFPDAKVIEAGKSTISNQDAFYSTLKFTFKTMGIEIPMKMMQLSTSRNNNVYILACRAPADIFDKNIIAYKLVLTGFTFMP